MKRSSLVRSAAAFACSRSLRSAARARRPPPPAISVSGEASVSVAPDLAQIDGGVTSEAKTAREASDANNAAMGKVLLALKGAGIDEKDYQTSRLSLQPQYAQPTPNRTGPPQITGYRASNRVTIKVRDITKVADTIDTLVGAGANEIGGINFIGVAGLESARRGPRQGDRGCAPQGRDLRQGRRRHARRAAQHHRRRRRRAPVSAARWPQRWPAAPTPVAPGEEMLSVTVNVCWAIKPAQ